jgi:hypothetical protein
MKGVEHDVFPVHLLPFIRSCLYWAITVDRPRETHFCGASARSSLAMRCSSLATLSRGSSLRTARSSRGAG